MIYWLITIETYSKNNDVEKKGLNCVVPKLRNLKNNNDILLG